MVWKQVIFVVCLALVVIDAEPGIDELEEPANDIDEDGFLPYDLNDANAVKANGWFSRTFRKVKKLTRKAAHDASSWTKKAAHDARSWTRKAAHDTGAWTKKAAHDAGAWTKKAAHDAAKGIKKGCSYVNMIPVEEFASHAVQESRKEVGADSAITEKQAMAAYRAIKMGCRVIGRKK